MNFGHKKPGENHTFVSGTVLTSTNVTDGQTNAWTELHAKEVADHIHSVGTHKPCQVCEKCISNWTAIARKSVP